ncbi:hypothetical protein ACIQF6_36130 [Kitasatospora sp. NPDC092948]|uniref:hypothetical protein n=1 Tax=Kitasatospora sp. NPDC092948 TaxID=3364088 RepID=UPI003822CEEB
MYSSDGRSATFTVLHDMLSGRMTIPADSVTTLLRDLADRWDAGAADPHQPPRSSESFAAELRAVADQIDVECIGVELRPLAEE